MLYRFLMLVTLLAVVAGCSSPADQPPRLRVQIDKFPESFSPIKINEFDGIIFQFLTERDSTDKIVSNLVEINEKIYVNDTISLFGFTLKPSAKWHDGNPVSKEDVYFTIKLNKCQLLTNTSAGIFHLDPIKAFLPDSANAASFQLEVHGNPTYGQGVAGDYLVMPEHVFDPNQVLRQYNLEQISAIDDSTAPDDLRSYFDRLNAIPAYDSVYFQGSGPYRVESFEVDQRITLGLLPQHGQAQSAERPLPEKIDYLIITDPTAGRFALQNGEIDLLKQIPAQEFVQLEAFNTDKGTLNLYKQAAFKFVFVGFNTRVGKFSDARTRQALAHLIDEAAIIDAVKLGYAQPTVGPVHPVLKDLYNNDIEPYALDMEKSRGLLQAAGWNFDGERWVDQNGATLDFTLTFNGSNVDYQKIALIIQSQAQKAGIRVSLSPDEGAALTKRLRSHQFEAVIWSFVGSPTAFNFSPLFHTAAAAPGKLNFTGFGNAVSDEAIERAILAPDREAMATHLRQLQKILHDESPMVFLYFEQSLMAASKRFPVLNISYYRPGYDPVGVF